MPSLKQLQFKLLVFSVRQYLSVLSLISPLKGGEKAFNLFSTPRKGRLTEQDRQFLKNATWQTVAFEGEKIQTYRWEGERGSVLFAHGWESNAARWKPLVSLLQKEGYACVALDAPAHGATGFKLFNPRLYAQMIHAVAEKHQPDVIVGHSVGGYASVVSLAEYAHPSVSKLVLMAAPSDLSHIFNAFLAFIKTPSYVKKAFYRYFEHRFGKKVPDFAGAHLARGIKAQTLIIHDRSDELIDFHDAYAYQSAFPTAEVIITEGYDHRLRDKAVYKMVVDFVKKKQV